MGIATAAVLVIGIVGTAAVVLRPSANAPGAGEVRVAEVVPVATPQASAVSSTSAPASTTRLPAVVASLAARTAAPHSIAGPDATLALDEPAASAAASPLEDSTSRSETVGTTLEAQVSADAIRSGSAAAATATPIVTRADKPAAAAEATSRKGWVCGGPVEISGPKGTAWSVRRVGFTVRRGYERVVLHVERTAQAAGAPPSVRAERVPASQLSEFVALGGRLKPRRSAIGIELADGIRGFWLRGFRPRGTQMVQAVWMRPTRAGSAKILVTLARNGCYRVRAPAWNRNGAGARSGAIYLDIKS